MKSTQEILPKSTFKNGLFLTSLCCISSAGAALTLTNGDFETGAASNNAAFPGWFSGHPGDWEEFRFSGISGSPDTAASFGIGASGETGYIYQQIGNYDGELTLRLDGTAYNRTSTNPTHNFGDFDVAFYYGTFSGADGDDVASSAVTIGALEEFSNGADGTPLTITDGNAATSASFSHEVSFAGSGISIGAPVWVRLGDSDGLTGDDDPDEPFFDNLSISTTIPEPTSAAFFGLAGIFLMLRRRK